MAGEEDRRIGEAKGVVEGFRPDIEGLRGLAVAVVVLFHAGLLGMVGGFVGVDVFFVISGFLITGLLVRERERTGRVHFLAFYARRMRRLAPAALLVLAVVLIASYVLVNPIDRSSVELDGATSVLTISNIRFAMTQGDYFNAVLTPSPFLHFWSLAVEEQFYLVWPALLFLVGRGRRPVLAIGLALCGVAAVSFYANLLVTASHPNWSFYSLPTRAWELSLGGLLAISSRRLAGLSPSILRLGFWLGLGVIGYSVFFLRSSVPYPGAAALLPSLGSVAMIAGGFGRDGARYLVTSAPLRFLGRISYSLYLWHWPILVLPAIAVGTQIQPLPTTALVGLSIVVAYLSWRFVEEPFHHRLPVLAVHPSRTLAGGLALMAALALVAGGATWQSDRSLADLGQSAVLTSTGPTGPTGPTVPPSVSYAVPKDVRPSVGAARGDTPEVILRARGCMAADEVSVPPECVFGDNQGQITLALVGDSHAAVWFPGLLSIATQNNWRLVTFLKVRCTFADLRLYNPVLKQEYSQCEAFGQATVARLQAIRPSLTLVSNSRESITPLNDSDSSPEAEAAAEARMVARLPGRVGIIMDTPSAGQDIPVCLSKHMSDIRPCAIPHSVAFSGAYGVREEAVVRSTGAGLIDLTNDICVADPCPVIVNKIILYRDDNHLTATFVSSLTQKLESRLKELMATG